MEQVPADTSRNIWIRMAEDDDFELDPSTFAEISKQQELKRKPSLLNNSLSSSSHLQLNINQHELIGLVSEHDEVSNHEDHPSQPSITKSPSFLSPSNFTDNQEDNHPDLQLVSPSSVTSTNVNTEVPPYTTFTKGKYTHYQCTKCPAHQSRLNEIKLHVQLHKKRSPSIPCPECGWFILPRVLAQHQGQHHPETNLNYSIDKRMDNVKNFKCKHCPAFSKHLSVMKRHVKLHLDGAQVWICEVNNCGWFVNPRTISYHLCRFHRYKCGEEMELSLDKLADTPSSTLSTCFPSPLTNPLPETHSLPDLEQLQPQAPIFIDLVDSDDEIEETQYNSLHNPPSNHPTSQPRSGPAVKKRMSKRMDNSNPDYIAYSIGNKRFFECGHCAYHGQRFEWMSKHLSVHDEGSEAVQCEECFWVIFPRRVPLHHRIHHRDLPIPQKGRDGKYQSVKNSNVKLQQFVDLYATKVGVSKMDYRCSECVASFTSLEACQVHAKRHIKPTYDWCKV